MSYPRRRVASEQTSYDSSIYINEYSPATPVGDREDVFNAVMKHICPQLHAVLGVLWFVCFIHRDSWRCTVTYVYTQMHKKRFVFLCTWGFKQFVKYFIQAISGPSPVSRG